MLEFLTLLLLRTENQEVENEDERKGRGTANSVNHPPRRIPTLARTQHLPTKQNSLPEMDVMKGGTIALRRLKSTANFEALVGGSRRAVHKDGDWRSASGFRLSKAAIAWLQPPNPPCQGGFWRGALSGGSWKEAWITWGFPPDKGGKGGSIGTRRQGRLETEPLPEIRLSCLVHLAHL